MLYLSSKGLYYFKGGYSIIILLRVKVQPRFGCLKGFHRKGLNYWKNFPRKGVITLFLGPWEGPGSQVHGKVI